MERPSFEDFRGNCNSKLCLPKNLISLYCREFIFLQDALLFVFLEGQQRAKISKYYRRPRNYYEKVNKNPIFLPSKLHFQAKSMAYSEPASKTESNNMHFVKNNFLPKIYP